MRTLTVVKILLSLVFLKRTCIARIFSYPTPRSLWEFYFFTQKRAFFVRPSDVRNTGQLAGVAADGPEGQGQAAAAVGGVFQYLQCANH